MLAEVPVITVAHCGPRRLLLGRDGADRAVTGSSRPRPTSPCPARRGPSPTEAELAAPDAPGLRGPGPGSDREERWTRAKAVIEDQFSWDAVAARWTELIDVLALRGRTVDVAMVTPWNSRCGIAEYSRQLVTGSAPAPGPRPGRPDVQPVDLDEEPAIARVWDDRWHPDLTDLTARDPRLPGRARAPPVQLRLLRAGRAGGVHRGGRGRARRRHHVPRHRGHADRRRDSSAWLHRRRARPGRPAHRPPAGGCRPAGRFRAGRQRAPPAHKGRPDRPR